MLNFKYWVRLMVFNSDAFYLILTLDIFNGIRNHAFAMVDEQTNFYNV
jgi:hypothetical protein